MEDYTMLKEPKVDLIFQVMGKSIPVDHGFALFGAICRVLPCFHEDLDAGMKLIRGIYIGEGFLDISSGSELVIRLPIKEIKNYLPLAGKTLALSGHRILIGVPNTSSIPTAGSLYCHLVTTKNGKDQPRFEAEITRQMDDLKVKGVVTVGARRTFQVHGKQVVGYAVTIEQLTAEESIILQENGLGGRRKMGCGFFEPMANDR
jgi:CRISPR-associated protein Cas6